MQSLPPDLRAKYEQLRGVIDPSTNQPVASALGDPCLGLSTNPSGGQRFNFLRGDICSFDHTGRFPVVCIYGPIYQFYDKLGNNGSPFGRPLTDIIDLQDGSKCGQFEGGHIHSWGDKAEPFPASHCAASYKPNPPPFPLGTGPAGMPISLHQKWVYLCTQRDPDRETIVEKLGTPCLLLEQNSNGGQRFNFLHGEIVSVDNNVAPCVVYGAIYTLWSSLGGVESGWGRPLADEQDLDDGGRCSVFEGGHIHRYGDVVQPFPADRCGAKFKPLPRFPTWNKMPAHFQRKWSQLATITHPHTRQSIVELLRAPCLLLNDNPNGIGGQNFHFLGGYLVSLSNEPQLHNSYAGSPNSYGGYSQSSYGYPPAPSPYGGPQNPYGSNSPYSNGQSPYGGSDKPQEMPLALVEPFAVYGTISQVWEKAGGLEGALGRPLCDEQDLPDGGRCSVFEGGHIHMYNGEAKEFPAHQCTAAYQPTAPSRRPVPYSPPPLQPPPQPQMSYSQGQPPAPSQPQYYNPAGGNNTAAPTGMIALIIFSIFGCNIESSDGDDSGCCGCCKCCCCCC